MKQIKIPETLIVKLKPFGPRYIKVAKPILSEPKSGKQAVEHAWQTRPYEADDYELQEWLKSGGNYGVKCGEGITGIDTDNPKLQEAFEAHVTTFTVKSGNLERLGKHYYCRSDVTDNGIIGPINQEGKRENWGNIQAKNKYLVGPGCNHYTGGTYEIINDVPLAWVSREALEKIFADLLAWTGERRKLSEEIGKEEKDLIGFDIPMTEIVPNFDELREIGDGEFQGPHAVHGSTTGQNFCVNIKKNCWYCFRCNSGGGPLSWLAVKHGLIRCDQAQRGALKGELFLKTIELGRKEGYDVKLDEIEEMIEPDVAKYFEGKPPRFVPAYLARELMKKFDYVTRKSDEVIFLYHPEKGIYTPDGEAHIKTQVEKALGKYLRRNRQSEVINYIVCSTLHDIKETPPNFVALRNGVFDVETGELKPFSPQYFILNSLPMKYDPQDDCQKIKKFVSEVVRQEDIPVLQEVAGYCLLRDYPIHRATMLIGEGANGKSTFLELLRAFLGHENVSGESLQGLEANRFAACSLFGKLANIYPDLSDRALRSTGMFKMLTGGDTISGEFKFKDRFRFKNYAKLIFSANKIPESPDDTTAFFRRWIIINFPNQFIDDDPRTDNNLLQKLTTEEELSGFFNWALEGLRRLLQNGHFSHCKSVEETREQYIRASDPVKAFAMDCIEFKAGSVVKKDEVYEAFIEYCQEHNLPTVAKNTFSMRLPQHVPNIKSEIRKSGKQRMMFWRDIAIVKAKAEKAENSVGSIHCTEIEVNENTNLQQYIDTSDLSDSSAQDIRGSSDNQSDLSKESRPGEEVIEDFEWKPGETFEEAMKRKKMKKHDDQEG